MPGQVITVDRKKYAVGLFWQPTGAGYVARTYARTLARSIDKKLNLYTEYRAMVGLGGKKLGHHSGMESAAAAITDSFGEYTSFLAVFAVDKFWYLVAVRNGVILEDKLFEKEQDARSEYFKLSEIPDWGAVFAPGAWGMPRAVERNISDVLNRSARSVLRPISHVRAGVVSAVLAVVFAVGLLWFFREPINQMIVSQNQAGADGAPVVTEYEQEMAQKERELIQQFETVQPPAPDPIVLPYDYLPDVTQRAEICYKAIALLMQPVTGWQQVSAECGEEYASVVFNRDTYGTLGGFEQVAAQIMPGAFMQQESDNSLYVRVALPQVATVASLDERDIETLSRAVLTEFQNANMSVDVQMVTDTLSNGVETISLDILEVAAESKLNPMQFMHIFSEFGGVYMTRCVWNASTRNWNYEVIIYAK